MKKKHLVKKRHAVRKSMLKKLLKFGTRHNKSYPNELNRDAIDDLSKYIDDKSEDNNLVFFEHCEKNGKPCERDITYKESCLE